MPLPGLISEGIPQRASPTEIHTLIPVPVRGCLPVFLYILKCKKFTAGMVKYTVYDDPDAALMAVCHKTPKIFTGPEESNSGPM